MKTSGAVQRIKVQKKNPAGEVTYEYEGELLSRDETSVKLEALFDRADVIVAGGVESMSMVPMGGNKTVPNLKLIERYPEGYTAMGVTAENVARKYGISREDQDAFAAD